MKTIQKLLGFLRPFIWEVCGSILLGIAAICAGIGMLGTSAYLIASAALHPSVAELQVAIVGVRFFGISRAAFRYLERLVSHSVNLHVLARLREWFYSQVEAVPPRELNTRKAGDLFARVMGDLETLENFYVRVVSPVVVAFVVGIGVSWFIGAYDTSLGWILAAGLLLNGLVLPVISISFSRESAKNLSAARADLAAQTVEMLQGLEDLQGGSVQKRWLARLMESGRAAGKWQMKTALLGGLSSGIGLLLMNLTVLGLLCKAIPLATQGSISGVSLAVILLMGMAGFEAVANLPQAAVTLNASLESARRLFELGEHQSVEVNYEGKPKGWYPNRIKLVGVSFSYSHEEAFHLENISFELRCGKKLAVVGPSGSGKTSLVNLLLRFWEPDQGQIVLDGIESDRFDPYQMRSYFAVISQSAYLFSASLRENLRMAEPAADDARMIQALQAAELSDWFSRLPKGLDTWVGDQGLRLSGGERQRLAIARALLQDRPYLILDEPVENLDPSIAGKVLDTIFGLFAERGIFVITHDFSILERVDEVVLLENGLITERGDPNLLKSARGRIAALQRLQAQNLAI